jgi:predicted metalloprotease with PDZ domain
MLNLRWETVLLYPAGHYASRIRVAPSVRLPVDWGFAGALDGVPISCKRATPRSTATCWLTSSRIRGTANFAAPTLALTAAAYQSRVGRKWRSLSDTTLDPILSGRRPVPWRSWQRNEDYYSAGLLIWLDADTLIRERTCGRRSLDDFASSFFGIDNGS